MTLKQLRDIVKAELNLDGNPDFPDVRLNLYINHAQRDVQKNLIGLGLKRWLTRQSVHSAPYMFFGNTVRKITKGSLQAVCGFGTVVSSTSSKTVTGTGTKFYNQVNVGDIIYSALEDGGGGYTYEQLGTIASIESNTSLTLAANSLKTTNGVSFGATINSLNGLVEGTDSLRFFEIYNNTTSLFGEAREVDIDVFREIIANLYLSPTWKKAVFARVGNDFYLYPSGTYAMAAYYDKVVSDLSADSDLTEIPAEFERYVVDRAKLYVVGGNPQAEQALAAEIQAEYQKYQAKGSARDDIEHQPRAILQ